MKPGLEQQCCMLGNCNDSRFGKKSREFGPRGVSSPASPVIVVLTLRSSDKSEPPRGRISKEGWYVRSQSVPWPFLDHGAQNVGIILDLSFLGQNAASSSYTPQNRESILTDTWKILKRCWRRKENKTITTLKSMSATWQSVSSNTSPEKKSMS